MIEPRFDDESPLECSGCAEPTQAEAIVDGKRTPICAECHHDSTFVCAGCSDRFWSADGARLYVSPSLYCHQCHKERADGASVSWQQRQDEHKDRFQQVRR
jgi:hypothetical protein